MNEILKAVESKKMKPSKAYKLLYKTKKRKKAKFVKIKFYTSEVKFISAIINLFLLFPISFKFCKKLIAKNMDEEMKKHIKDLTLYKKDVIRIKVNKEFDFKIKAL